MGWTVRGMNPGRNMIFFLHQNVQTGAGTNPASYSMGTRG